MSEKNIEKGRWGEDMAAAFLLQAGYHIRQRNWRAGRGELDIICEKGGTLIFIEVKMGQTEKFGPPEYRITKAKQRQLYRIAQLYLQEFENQIAQFTSIRFDVIIIDGPRDHFEIRHYENAFTV